ncbi:hypothetical protein ACVIHA_006188 [Bradyrhizobium liaoningense]
MLGAAVVPEGDGVLGPAEAALEQRVLGVLVEISQHRIALVARDAVDVAGEAAVDVERLPARDRMRAHDGMLGMRIRGTVGHAVIGVESAIDRFAIVQRGEPVEIGLHAVRQRLIGRVHVGEQRVAAAWRALPDVKDRAHRRLEIAGHVGMPALAIGARRILVGVDLHQRRIVVLVRRGRMDMQFAELAAEGEMLLRRDVLIAEEDHEVFGKRAMDLVHLPVGAGVALDERADIDARDFRADDRGELFDRNGFVRRTIVRHVAIARTLLAGE